jgi:hypothetical protein
MRKMYLVLLLVISLSMKAFPVGPEYIGIPSDKYMHTVTNAFITHWVETEWGWEWWQSLIAVNVLGVLKESLDKSTGGHYDYGDIMANNVGWLIPHLKLEFRFDL